MTVSFTLLGTGAGPGVPSYFCDCVACKEARDNPQMARTRSGALIDTGKETILVDASPDLRAQLIKEQINTIDYVFLTHWHYDHFGGLGDLEFYVKLSRHKPVTLFLPPDAVEQFRTTYPFLHDVFDILPWQFGETHRFENLILTPLPARHSIQTAGIFLESNAKLAYFTDTSGLPDPTIKRIKQCDLLICDATFYGENWYPQSHMSIEEAVRLGQKIEANNTVLTHLAMHYSIPISTANLQEELKKYPRVTLGYDGMKFMI